jgi:hypothetical protein
MAAKGITLFGATVPFLAYLFVGSMLFHLYNQTSYQALGELSPLDISVANAVKTSRDNPGVGGGFPEPDNPARRVGRRGRDPGDVPVLTRRAEAGGGRGGGEVGLMSREGFEDRERQICYSRIRFLPVF